jgi:uncharacterized protein YjiK
MAELITYCLESGLAVTKWIAKNNVSTPTYCKYQNMVFIITEKQTEFAKITTERIRTRAQRPATTRAEQISVWNK